MSSQPSLTEEEIRVLNRTRVNLVTEMKEHYHDKMLAAANAAAARGDWGDKAEDKVARKINILDGGRGVLEHRADDLHKREGNEDSDEKSDEDEDVQDGVASYMLGMHVPSEIKVDEQKVELAEKDAEIMKLKAENPRLRMENTGLEGAMAAMKLDSSERVEKIGEKRNRRTA